MLAGSYRQSNVAAVNDVGIILIVDDDLSSSRLLSDLLRAEGHEVRYTRDAKSALMSAVRSPPDLVLLDVQMPELDGFETCRQLKSEPALRNIPVLFLSGLTKAFNRNLAFECGAVDYIRKPYEAPDVRARVNAHLRLRQVHAELAQKNRALEVQRREQKHLFAMIAHDMKSPLTAVLGCLELLRTSSDFLTDDARELMRDAEQGAIRVNELVSDLLSFQAMEEGKLVLGTEEGVNLRALIEESLVPLPRLERDRVQVEASNIFLFCDCKLISRVIANLVINALRHSPRGGLVQILARSRAESVVRVEVLDHGPGVEEELQLQVFEKYFSTDRAGGSTGLGLAFSKLAVEAHGGKIGVSNRPGGGACFWFECPLRLEQEE